MIFIKFHTGRSTKYGGNPNHGETSQFHYLGGEDRLILGWSNRPPVGAITFDGEEKAMEKGDKLAPQLRLNYSLAIF